VDLWQAVENIVKRLSQQGACDVAGEIQRVSIPATCPPCCTLLASPSGIHVGSAILTAEHSWVTVKSNLYAIPLKQAMAGLDINAPYCTSAGGEGGAAAVRGAGVMTMTAGHKLSLELVQHPHTPAAAKMEGVNATLGCGLDANARWCEGRASGIVGATLLASVLLTYIHTYTRTSIWCTHTHAYTFIHAHARVHIRAYIKTSNS